MNDIKLSQLSNGTFDISVTDGDLTPETGFETAMWVSLFTDARAQPENVVLSENRRGWMGNVVSPVSGRDLGGLLWLTDQRRLTQNTLNETIDYARKSLSWFVEDGLAINVDVSGEIVPQSGITLTIVFTAPDGSTETHYVPLWKETINAN